MCTQYVLASDGEWLSFVPGFMNNTMQLSLQSIHSCLLGAGLSLPADDTLELGRRKMRSDSTQDVKKDAIEQFGF